MRVLSERRRILPLLAAVLMIGAGYLLAAPAAAQTPPVCPPDHIWHAPACGHEHGDPAPPWIVEAGYQAGFDEHGGFHGNTTPQENTTKHRSMKGMHAVFPASNQEVYVRLHFASNVLERMSRYHSYELFLKDAAGNVSHYQGWTNTGDPSKFRGPNEPLPAPGESKPGRVSKVARDDGARPVILVTDLASLQQGRNCETWYATTSTWGPEFGWTICDSTTLYYPEEAQYTDYEFPLCQYGYPTPVCLGNNRELELSLYLTGSANAAGRGNLAPKDVEFYATQFGEGVSGPDDPRCQAGAMTTRFGKDYQNLCLPQFVASTARAIENLPSPPYANRFRKDYPITDSNGAVVVAFPN